MATGLQEPRAAAAALLGLGASLAIVKRGHEGVYARTARDELTVPPVETRVLNGLGAGDAFIAAFVHSLHTGGSLEEAARRGSVAGAIVASQLACSEAMPSLAELEAELR